MGIRSLFNGLRHGTISPFDFIKRMYSGLEKIFDMFDRVWGKL